jgi:hypothetical protein
MFCYQPTDPLNLCVSLGTIFEDDNVTLSVHMETAYEFELYGVHLEPTLGYAYNAEDMHISLTPSGYCFCPHLALRSSYAV